ncbi:MAG: MYG1 family protein, partial [bacterium]|nr:MYG1 family protein [bacterium]
DHHMPEGAGTRENGIPYASFGLVWKEFGEKLAGGKREAEIIDKHLIQTIDAYDNGVAVSEYIFKGVKEYTIGDFFNSYMTSIGTNSDVLYKIFMENVEIAKGLLSREILRAKERAIGEDIVIKHYENSSDKRLVELPREGLPWESLANFPEPLYVLYPRRDGHWGIRAISDITKPFGYCRKPLPAQWAGKAGGELQKATGVPDAIFVHSKRFMAAAMNKEAALKLAEMALNA